MTPAQELAQQRNSEFAADPIEFIRQRKVETWICPHCGSQRVTHSSYGDGIISACGFAPYPWNWEPGRTKPTLRRFI